MWHCLSSKGNYIPIYLHIAYGCMSTMYMYIIYITTYDIHIHDLLKFESQDFMEASQYLCHQIAQHFVTKKMCNFFFYLLDFKIIGKYEIETPFISQVLFK
jgi:hypothetical protein